MLFDGMEIINGLGVGVDRPMALHDRLIQIDQEGTEGVIINIFTFEDLPLLPVDIGIKGGLPLITLFLEITFLPGID